MGDHGGENGGDKPASEPSPAELFAMSQEDFNAYTMTTGDPSELLKIEHAHIERCLNTGVDHALSDFRDSTTVRAIDALAARTITDEQTPRRGPKKHRLKPGFSHRDLVDISMRTRQAYSLSDHIEQLAAAVSKGRPESEGLASLRRRDRRRKSGKGSIIPQRPLLLYWRERGRQLSIRDKVAVQILSEAWENPGVTRPYNGRADTGRFLRFVNSLIRIIDPARRRLIQPEAARKYLREIKKTQK